MTPGRDAARCSAIHFLLKTSGKAASTPKFLRRTKKWMGVLSERAKRSTFETAHDFTAMMARGFGME